MDAKDSQNGREKLAVIEEKLGVGISADLWWCSHIPNTRFRNQGNSDLEITRYDPEGIKIWSRVIQSNMDDVALDRALTVNEMYLPQVSRLVTLRTT